MLFIFGELEGVVTSLKKTRTWIGYEQWTRFANLCCKSLDISRKVKPK